MTQGDTSTACIVCGSTCEVRSYDAVTVLCLTCDAKHQVSQVYLGGSWLERYFLHSPHNPPSRDPQDRLLCRVSSEMAGYQRAQEFNDRLCRARDTRAAQLRPVGTET